MEGTGQQSSPFLGRAGWISSSWLGRADELASPWSGTGGGCRRLVGFHQNAQEGFLAAIPCLELHSRRWTDAAVGAAVVEDKQNVAAHQGQDALVHPDNIAAHHVGAGRAPVVVWPWFATLCTGVSVVHITTIEWQQFQFSPCL